MKGNKNNKKKNKNYYKYHNNHNNYNKYNNKKFYYQHKNKKKQNVVIENNQSNQNILLNNEVDKQVDQYLQEESQVNQVNIEQQEDIQINEIEENQNEVQDSEQNILQEQSIQINEENDLQQESNQIQEEQKPVIQQVIRENSQDYEELDFKPVKKGDRVDFDDKPAFFKYAIGFVILVAIVFGISYSFFNYRKEDSRQGDIAAGEIYVKLEEETATLSLTKMYPRTKEEARSRNDNYIDFTIKAKNTSGTKEINYAINITNGDDVQGKTRINPQYLVVDLEEKVNNTYTYIKNAVPLSSFSFDNVVPVNTTSEITKEYRLRVWVSDSIIISDSETNASYTQAEFANLYANLHVEINSQDQTPVPPICKRATVLHTEECNYTSGSDYCYGDGYYNGGTKGTSTITYGNLGTSGNTPVAGDAFDCDVNGNGTYDERFYYVSPYFNTNNQTFDNTTATLIYYSNTFNNGSSVIVSTSGAAYATQADLQAAYPLEVFTSYDNWHGPVTAITHLPSTSQWSNITLKNTLRAILAETTSTHNSTTNSGGTLPTAFSYSGCAARILTAQELMRGCGLTQVGDYIEGELSGCIFLFEGTKYSDVTKATMGSWLETPFVSHSDPVWHPNAYSRYLTIYSADNINVGVRPTIDVPMDRIEY